MGKLLCRYPYTGKVPVLEKAVPGAVVCDSTEQLLALLQDFSSDDIFVIGGGSVYKAAFKYAGRLYITHIKAVAKQADTFFPEIDPEEWEAVQTSEIFSDEENKIEYQFVVYQKKKLK